MAKVSQIREQEQMEQHACSFIAKLDSGPLSESDEAELRDWLQADARHKNALMEMAKLMDHMGVLSRLSDLFPLDTQVPGYVKKTQKSSKWLVPMAVGLCCALVVMMLSWGVNIIGENTALQSMTASTDIGEIKTLVLQDGSKVTLNTFSQIEVEFSEKERAIHLIRGEALFEVAHNKSRAFLVIANNKVVKAIGTAFNVRIGDGNIEVTVTDGTVEVEKIAEDNSDLSMNIKNIDELKKKVVTRMTRGQEAVIADTLEFLQPIAAVDIEKKLLWQKGILIFEGESLEHVVAEISRYTSKKIIISDQATKEIRIGGYFETGDIVKLFDILESGFNISVKKEGPDTIHLSSKYMPSREVRVVN